MEDSDGSQDDMRKTMKDLASLTRRLVENHLQLSVSNRKLDILIRDHDKWLRDHEVRLQSHYRSLSNLKDRLR